MARELVLTESGYEPFLQRPKLPAALTLFPVTRAAHAWLYRDHLEDYEVFRRTVVAECVPGCVALDVGAGRGAPPAINLRGRAGRVIGIDMTDDIRRNPNLDECHVGSVEHMPFLASGSIDLAFARYVAEHLERPVEALREIRRVLKPGGRFLFITPNRRHYVPAIASRLGTGLHKVVNSIRGRPAEDTFPTVYALNTPEEIATVASSAGFADCDVQLFETQPNYLTFHPLLFAAGVVYERAVNGLSALARVRGSIVAFLVA